ncbi:epoxide hydrolase, soluble (sEH), variant 2 [Stylosanthes scabra]|uniref:Epoxide hydrolase, soluble (SEH), variant 2 n=1 Tax=Stylosanthes scabra TaxID=79078 RepID=A0ABU6WDT8_9FABA|nr:epoxide hydrolase, soluble (sEH), variant 2 [Stylosanthes scabra]
MAQPALVGIIVALDSLLAPPMAPFPSSISVTPLLLPPSAPLSNSRLMKETSPRLFGFLQNMVTPLLVFLLMELFRCGKNLLKVAACSDGHVRVYELLDPLELRNWQLQAEFQNVIESVSAFGKALCFSASISWNPQKGGSQESSFLIGFNSNTSELNSSKVWEFDQAHQRWLPVAELALPEEKGDQVYAVSWAPSIGRPYETIAVATQKGISIWHLGLNPDHNGRLPVERVALLPGHEGLVWQMEWDMSGMTLATTGHDGMVRLWQSNLNGIWHQQAMLEPTT